MRLPGKLFSFLLCCIIASSARAQPDESPLRIFGYFQNSLVHMWNHPDEPDQNSFSVQQLNVFFQKDLAPKWRAFVDFETLNTFSTSRRTGDFNLEEAWVRYRASAKFNLKLGLHIPIFNHLNDINNRTPILPYVIRPLVYEDSFSEFIEVEEYTPKRAFVQAYGFLPVGNVKVDYAAYVGNSPNIAVKRSGPLQQVEDGQTGIDTTDTFLLGGRIGLRLGEIKTGFSLTHDNVNFFEGVEVLLGGDPARFNEVSRLRLGGDFAFYWKKFFLESEIISVIYDDNTPEISIDKQFYYATLGYRIKDTFLVYATYWLTRQDIPFLFPIDENDLRLVTVKLDVKVPGIGFAFNLNDRVTIKGQFAPVDLDEEIRTQAIKENREFNHLSTAVSVFF